MRKVVKSEQIPFSVRFDPEVLDRLRAAARKRERSVGSLLRRISREWLDAEER